MVLFDLEDKKQLDLRRIAANRLSYPQQPIDFKKNPEIEHGSELM
jgi:hypothetical protein